MTIAQRAGVHCSVINAMLYETSGVTIVLKGGFVCRKCVKVNKKLSPTSKKYDSPGTSAKQPIVVCFMLWEEKASFLLWLRN